MEYRGKSGRMNEAYRPITYQEKRRHELRYMPWGYEYQMVPLAPERGPKQEMKGALDRGGSAWAALLWLILKFLLPESEESDIEGGGKIETPQSTIAKSSML